MQIIIAENDHRLQTANMVVQHYVPPHLIAYPYTRGKGHRVSAKDNFDSRPPVLCQDVYVLGPDTMITAGIYHLESRKLYVAYIRAARNNDRVATIKDHIANYVRGYTGAIIETYVDIGQERHLILAGERCTQLNATLILYQPIHGRQLTEKTETVCRVVPVINADVMDTYLDTHGHIDVTLMARECKVPLAVARKHQQGNSLAHFYTKLGAPAEAMTMLINTDLSTEGTNALPSHVRIFHRLARLMHTGNRLRLRELIRDQDKNLLKWAPWFRKIQGSNVTPMMIELIQGPRKDLT